MDTILSIVFQGFLSHYCTTLHQKHALGTHAFSNHVVCTGSPLTHSHDNSVVVHEKVWVAIPIVAAGSMRSSAHANRWKRCMSEQMRKERLRFSHPSHAEHSGSSTCSTLDLIPAISNKSIFQKLNMSKNKQWSNKNFDQPKD